MTVNLIYVTRWDDGKSILVNPSTIARVHEAERFKVDPVTRESTGEARTVSVLTMLEFDRAQLVVAEDMETVYRRANGVDL